MMSYCASLAADHQGLLRPIVQITSTWHFH